MVINIIDGSVTVVPAKSNTDSLQLLAAAPAQYHWKLVAAAYAHLIAMTFLIPIEYKTESDIL